MPSYEVELTIVVSIKKTVESNSEMDARILVMNEGTSVLGEDDLRCLYEDGSVSGCTIKPIYRPGDRVVVRYNYESKEGKQYPWGLKGTLGTIKTVSIDGIPTVVFDGEDVQYSDPNILESIRHAVDQYDYIIVGSSPRNDDDPDDQSDPDDLDDDY